MNVLLLLGTVIGFAGLTLAAILSLAMGARLRAVALGVGALSWLGLYVIGVLVASLASHETVLPAGATKRFCGFYLDCHLGVAVLGDSTAPAIAGRRAAGTFHVLTLQFSSNARQATLTPYDLRIAMVDANGRYYEPDLEAEAALSGGTLRPLARPIRAGDSYQVPVVFDLPRGTVAPRLFVGEGLGIDRVIEGVLLGDEDSFLHRKTMLALPG
jgi:hypothetical protein